jgi:hypothetical protein
MGERGWNDRNKRKKTSLDALKPLGGQTTEAYPNSYLTNVKYE